jgi:hypothetical protein
MRNFSFHIDNKKREREVMVINFNKNKNLEFSKLAIFKMK